MAHEDELLTELEALRRRVAELERDRAELAALYHEAPVGLCLVDRNLRFVRVSQRLAEMNGRSVDAHVGRSVAEVFPEFAEDAIRTYRRVIKTGRPVVNRELRGSLPSAPEDELIWLVHNHPVKASDGTVTGVVSVLQDVTLLKATADELLCTRERLAEALRVAGIASWEWDLVADRLWWSDELYRMFGREQGYFTPSFDAFIESVHPEDRPMIRKQLDATFAHDEPYAVEFRALSPDGTERIVRSHAELTRAADGTPLRLVGTAQEITTERRVEAAIAAAEPKRRSTRGD